MKLTRVLIVFKKSTLQLQVHEFQEQRFLKLLEEGHTSVAKVKMAHEQHVQTLELLETELNKRSIAYEMVARADLDSSTVENYDLVFSVGGDGTFLDVSHFLRRIPILGINSALSSSFGHYCIANQKNLAEILDKLQSGELGTQRLLRLQLSVNGTLVPSLVLNEVLIAHSSPAGTSRYLINIGSESEEQRSSGIWVGPPGGSTGALKAAGGEIQPITAKEYQYVVREPWERPGQNFKLIKGRLALLQELRIISQMRTGSLYIDGNHLEVPFVLGDELCILPSKEDLIAFVNPTANDIFLNG